MGVDSLSTGHKVDQAHFREIHTKFRQHSFLERFGAFCFCLRHRSHLRSPFAPEGLLPFLFLDSVRQSLRREAYFGERPSSSSSRPRFFPCWDPCKEIIPFSCMLMREVA